MFIQIFSIIMHLGNYTLAEYKLQKTFYCFINCIFVTLTPKHFLLFYTKLGLLFKPSNKLDKTLIKTINNVES